MHPHPHFSPRHGPDRGAGHGGLPHTRVSTATHARRLPHSLSFTSAKAEQGRKQSSFSFFVFQLAGCICKCRNCGKPYPAEQGGAGKVVRAPGVWAGRYSHRQSSESQPWLDTCLQPCVGPGACAHFTHCALPLPALLAPSAAPTGPALPTMLGG